MNTSFPQVSALACEMLEARTITDRAAEGCVIGVLLHVISGRYDDASTAL